MDSETIIKLIDAGYTKAEIDAMETKSDAGAEGAAGSEGAEGSEGAGASEGKPEEKEKEKEITSDAAIKALTETVNSLTQTVKAMQAANIQGAQGGKAENKTVTDVMKSFIDSL